jgi:hypothetical protein
MTRMRRRFNLPTLPGNPSVTIYMDGLIILFHGRGLTQAALHARAPHHALKLSVIGEDDELVWPRGDSPWKVSHEELRAIEPFWLFVSSEEHPAQEPPEESYSSSLETSGDMSFDNVLDFESHLYNHPLEDFRRARVALLNMPHGRFYSAGNGVSDLHSFEQGQQPEEAEFERPTLSSFLVGADIRDRSTEDAVKYLVLLQTNKQDGRLMEVFSIPLPREGRYELHIMNTPRETTHRPSAAEHFLLYYDLFELRADEKKFFLTPKDGSPREEFFGGPDSPPCDNTRGSLTGPMS